MTLYDLVKHDDPGLHQATSPTTFDDPGRIKDIVDGLKKTMVEKQGFGLAANQVGLNESIFVIGNASDPGSIKEFINPRLVHVSDETNLMDEGCLSFPGLFLKIKRPVEVRIRYQDVNGQTMTNTYRGMTARIIQHEFDHLQGRIFMANVSRTKLDMAMRQAYKKHGVRY